jgi:phosphate starvation-inducible PhoH-like protein
MVVTGDATQIDLPTGKRSGLLHAIDVLKGVEGIRFIQFDDKDVVRHTLVARIVRAYERYQEAMIGSQMSLKLTDDGPLDRDAAAPNEAASAVSAETGNLPVA